MKNEASVTVYRDLENGHILIYYAVKAKIAADKA